MCSRIKVNSCLSDLVNLVANETAEPLLGQPTRFPISRFGLRAALDKKEIFKPLKSSRHGGVKFHFLVDLSWNSPGSVATRGAAPLSGPSAVGRGQGCQVGFFEANFLESGFFPRQLASQNVGWLFIEIWLFPGFFLCC